MKKSLMIAASAAMAFSFNFGASAGKDEGFNTWVEVCKMAVDDGFFESLGSCVGQNGGNQSVKEACSDEANWPHVADISGKEIKNKGTCVAAARAYINSTDYTE